MLLSCPQNGLVGNYLILCWSKNLGIPITLACTCNESGTRSKVMSLRWRDKHRLCPHWHGRVRVTDLAQHLHVVLGANDQFLATKGGLRLLRVGDAAVKPFSYLPSVAYLVFVGGRAELAGDLQH